MARTAPYQPFLLRLLHGGSALLAIGAILTGFLVYNTYDGRWGRLPIPKISEIEGIHGTFGLFFLLLLPAFALYSFHAGQKRLIQPQSLSQLTAQVGQPIWWVNLQRLTNTLMLVAATVAVITGRMMQEKWMTAGELHHVWYSLHLLAWVGFIVSLLLHLLMSARVGGAPLLLSMWRWER